MTSDKGSVGQQTAATRPWADITLQGAGHSHSKAVNFQKNGKLSSRMVHNKLGYTHVYTHVHIHVYRRVHTHVYTHVYTHVCANVCMHVHAHVYTRVHTDVHTHIHTHVYTHVCTLVGGSTDSATHGKSFVKRDPWAQLLFNKTNKTSSGTHRV